MINQSETSKRQRFDWSREEWVEVASDDFSDGTRPVPSSEQTKRWNEANQEILKDWSNEPEDRPITDDAPVDHVLVEMRRCALCWQGDARLLGNVRAKDMVRAITAALSAMGSRYA